MEAQELGLVLVCPLPRRATWDEVSISLAPIFFSFVEHGKILLHIFELLWELNQIIVAKDLVPCLVHSMFSINVHYYE